MQVIYAGFILTYFGIKQNITKALMFQKKKTHLDSALQPSYEIENFDLNAKLNIFFPEDSINMALQNPYPFLQDESRNFDQISNNSNMFPMNFWDPSKILPPLEDHQMKRFNEQIVEESQEDFNIPSRGNCLNKGLKYLAYLIYRTLKKKSFSSADQLSKNIEVYLANKQKTQSLLERNKQRSPKLGNKPSSRRRIYDALNVLIAMGLISKNKSSIELKDSPLKKIYFTDKEQTLKDIHRALRQKQMAIACKRKILKEKNEQYQLLKLLLERNRSHNAHECHKVNFPFFIVQSQQSINFSSRSESQKRVKVDEKNKIFGDLNTLPDCFNVQVKTQTLQQQDF